MVTIIFKKEKAGLSSDLIIEIARRLREALGDRLVALDSVNTPDGSNVRIVVRDKTFEDVKKIMKIIGEIEEKHDIHGKILPEIIGESVAGESSEES